MKPVFLIAANLLREHRWPVLILFAWIVLTALAVGSLGRERVAPEDVIFCMQQQAIYICVFSAFLAAHAIQNERKSRRILLVLSKAISRGQYLLAIILGTCAMAVVSAVLFGIYGAWLGARAAMPNSAVWSMAILVIAASVITATVALFFSTFLNSYLATALTLLAFCVPGAWHAQRHAWSVWLPGFAMLVDVLRFNLHAGWRGYWIATAIAFAESLFFWAMATMIFSRKDVAVPVE